MKSLQKLIREVDKEGFYVIPEFLSVSECEQAVFEIDNAIDEYSSKLWTGALNADKRIFGIEKASAIASKFINSEFVLEILKRLNKTNSLDLTVLGAKIESIDGNLGSGEGWHRDKFDTDQFKAILYLTDVSLQNGPFQILYRSHKYWMRSWLHLFYNLKITQTRFNQEEEIQTIESLKTKTFCAKRGSLIIANTRSIHRGMPINEGVRYAMTIYNWPKGQFPDHIKKYSLL